MLINRYYSFDCCFNLKISEIYLHPLTNSFMLILVRVQIKSVKTTLLIPMKGILVCCYFG